MKQIRPLPTPGWHVRFGVGVRRAFVGVEMERLVNGLLWRVSFWPMRSGFFVVLWNEPARIPPSLRLCPDCDGAGFVYGRDLCATCGATGRVPPIGDAPREPEPCAECGHPRAEHNGYGGICKAGGDVCGCVEFSSRPSDTEQK